MARATRIEKKSRPSKRRTSAQYSTGGKKLVQASRKGRIGRLDRRGFPATNGVAVENHKYNTVA